MKDFNKVLVLINSEGDKGKINNFIIFLHENFEEYLTNGKIVISKTIDSSSTKVISHDFSNKYENSLIISFGGDGTVHEIVNSMNFDNSSLAVMPNGTGNDFAKHLYSCSSGKFDYESIFQRLLDIKIREVDLIKINEHICMNTCSFGYDTCVLEKSLQIKKKLPFLRKLSFKLAIPLTLNQIRPVEYSYSLKEESGNVISDKGAFILSALCNGSMFGGGFTPAPDALIDDGIINVNLVNNLGLLKLLMSISSYKDGSHVNKLKESHNYKVVSGSIIPQKDKIYGNIDGELYEFDKIDFEIMPKALRLVY